jgi:hypothetical protein
MQVALVHCKLTYKDEAKAGNHILMDMKAESMRLVFNRWPDLYGPSLSRFHKLLPILASWSTKLIYSRSLPTARSRLALWLVTFQFGTDHQRFCPSAGDRGSKECGREQPLSHQSRPPSPER